MVLDASSGGVLVVLVVAGLLLLIAALAQSQSSAKADKDRAEAEVRRLRLEKELADAEAQEDEDEEWSEWEAGNDYYEMRDLLQDRLWAAQAAADAAPENEKMALHEKAWSAHKRAVGELDAADLKRRNGKPRL